LYGTGVKDGFVNDDIYGTGFFFKTSTDIKETSTIEEFEIKTKVNNDVLIHVYGQGIYVDDSNNIYISGCTNGIFDDEHQNIGHYDIFLLKYNPSSNYRTQEILGMWGSLYTEEVFDMKFNNNSLFLTGYTFEKLNEKATGTRSDIFLLKYNLDNTYQIEQTGNDGNERATSLTIDNLNNIYISGYTNYVAYIDEAGNSICKQSEECGYEGFSIIGKKDIILTKFNSSMEKQWSRQLGTIEDDEITGITADKFGNIFLTGYTSGSFKNTSDTNPKTLLIKYSNEYIKIIDKNNQ